MLHRLFHRNAPYSLIGLFIFLFLLTLPILIDSSPLTVKEIKWMALGKQHHPLEALNYNNAPPLAVWIFGILDWILGSSPIMRKMAALAILFFEVVYFSKMIVHRKVFESPTYIQGVVMGLLILFSFDSISLTPDLFASLFLLPALNRIMGEVSFGADRRSPAFMLGLYLGLASLCVFWHGLYLLAALLALALFSSLSARKAASLTLAFLFPHLLLLLLSACFDCVGNFIHFYYESNFSSWSAGGFSWSSLFLESMALVVFLGISLLQFWQRKSRSLFHSQVTLIMLLWLVASLAAVSFSEKYPHSLIACAPPISLLFTTYIVGLQRKRRMEILLWLFLISMSFSLYWQRYKSKGKADYSLLYPVAKYREWQGKKILALCHEPSLYLKNEPSAMFINWESCEEIFSAPQFYENQTAVAKAFAKDAPHVIVDPKNLMSDFLAHQPKLRERFKRQGDCWVLGR